MILSDQVHGIVKMSGKRRTGKHDRNINRIVTDRIFGRRNSKNVQLRAKTDNTAPLYRFGVTSKPYFFVSE